MTLLESSDPVARADAHLSIGWRAIHRGDKSVGVQHFREARALMPTCSAPIAALHAVGEPRHPRFIEEHEPSLLARLLSLG